VVSRFFYRWASVISLTSPITVLKTASIVVAGTLSWLVLKEFTLSHKIICVHRLKASGRPAAAGAATATEDARGGQAAAAGAAAGAAFQGNFVSRPPS
jgi:hypothetical protein